MAADLYVVAEPLVASRIREETASPVLNKQICPLIYTVIAETTSMDASFAGAKNEQITSLGDLSLVVISSSAILELAATPEFSAKADKVMRELQREIVGQSSKGIHIVAEETTHFIQLVKPKVMIEAIQQVLP